MQFDRKQHWEKIYQTKALKDVSWFQPKPETSLQFVQKLKVPLSAKIIDIGGGDGFLVDHLLQLGYTNITVLDISAAAIERAKKRLSSAANSVKWIVADVASFQSNEKYDLWHDRAAFHFLTDEAEISAYIKAAHEILNPAGQLIIGTFSKQGPEKCSGIPIKQYSESSMAAQFSSFFDKIDCLTTDHTTPFNTVQNFTFCSFSKR